MTTTLTHAWPSRTILFLASIALLAMVTPACRARMTPSERPVAIPYTGIVEAGCARCRFQAAKSGCDLAIHVDGHTWLVAGTAIDDHGDAHAADGFCNATRQARVTGRFEGDLFVADEFELLPSKP